MSAVARWILTLLLSLPAGCSRHEPEPGQAPTSGARSTSDLGTLELSLSQTELTTVDRLTVTLVLSHAGGVGASELLFAPEQSGWTVVSVSTEGPRIARDGSVLTRWTYTLEPFLDGEYDVPPASVDLHDAESASTLTTPAQSVGVASVIGKAGPELAGARAPVELPEASERSSVGPLVIAGGGGLVLFAGAWWWVRSRRRMRAGDCAPQSRRQGPREEVATVRDDLIAMLSARVGHIPPTATSDELLALTRTRIDPEQHEALRLLLSRLDRLLYGPGAPAPGAVAGARADLDRLIGEQEATA